MFLGLPDDQAKLIRQEAPESALGDLPEITTVQVESYNAYLSAKQAGRIREEQRRQHWVYWAVEDWRDARFPNGTSAMYVFTQRYKSPLPAE